MTRTTRLVVLLSAVCVSMTIGHVAEAGGRSGWGWAKPLNKRMGAFYTSNKNANFNRSRSSSYYRHGSRQMAYPSHYRSQHKVVQPYVVPPQSGHRFVPAPAHPHANVQRTIVPSVRPHVVPKHVAPAVAQPKGNILVPKHGAAAPSLPHNSTATQIWQ